MSLIERNDEAIGYALFPPATGPIFSPPFIMLKIKCNDLRSLNVRAIHNSNFGL
jgi:hypothetical protein